jgi:hypothetical protein
LKSFAPEDEGIIHANIASILADPHRIYGLREGKFDAIGCIEIAIARKSETIKQHAPRHGEPLSEWSREITTRLSREIGLMEEALQRLDALGFSTTSPLAVQLRREREHPIPTAMELLAPARELYEAGKHRRQAAALFHIERPLLGVDAGKIRSELIGIAVVTRLTKEPLNLSLTAGWGRAGQGGVTMPGKGKLTTNHVAPGPDYKLPWLKLHDVYLNDDCCWKNIPDLVWDYTIGGYQVIKKWLSYREFSLLGRALTRDEAREVTHMARRIAALILLQPELDKNYNAVKSAAAPWPG